jgi:hypothetical protein
VITGHLHRTSLIIGDLPCTILATISNVSVSYFIPKQTHILVYIYSYCISVQRHIQIIHTQFSATLLCYCSLVSVIRYYYIALAFVTCEDGLPTFGFIQITNT